MKEAYDLWTRDDTKPMDQKWQKLWKEKIWPKLSIFSLLVMRKHILIRENIKKRGMVGPYRCFLCEHEEETIIHLLYSRAFTTNIWDQGAMKFKRYDRVKQNLDQMLIE